MNYLPMMPAAYYNNAYQAPFTMGMQNHRENKIAFSEAVLKTLSQALRKSIMNYEERSHQSCQKQQEMVEESISKPKAIDNSKKIIETVIGEETHKENLKNIMEREKTLINITKKTSSDRLT